MTQRGLLLVMDGDQHSVGSLVPAIPEGLSEAVYARLRVLAQQQMNNERAGITLQPTALVHEAYLRLLRDPTVRWDDDREFYWAAAQSMRRVLIDEARRRNAIKRGGDRDRVALDDPPDTSPSAEPGGGTSVERLDEALDGLRDIDARLYEVVMLRYFAGLTVETTAETLGVGARTVKRDWAMARSWLRVMMGGGDLGAVS
ncbi:MAG: ECF-type sigma factor [Planctomycetota bacterium]